MARDVDVFLAIPDRLVHNRRTARGVLLMTYKHQIPVAAYSRAYVDAGASLALFATPENIAIATANIAVSKVTGKNDIDCLEKTTLSVKTNSHVSKLLRLNMHPEKTIRDALLKRLEGCAYE